MKKIILTGVVVSLSLLYFETSCGKKELASILQTVNSDFSSISTRSGTEIVSDSHKQLYTDKLTQLYTVIAQVHKSYTYFNPEIIKFDDNNRFIVRDIQEKILTPAHFTDRVFALLDQNQPNSMLFIAKLIKNNPKITYQELLTSIDALFLEVDSLSKTANNFITAIKNSNMDTNTKNIVLQGTTQDYDSGFIGFESIYSKFTSVKIK